MDSLPAVDTWLRCVQYIGEAPMLLLSNHRPLDGYYNHNRIKLKLKG
jgi:hypothetical protein